MFSISATSPLPQRPILVNVERQSEWVRAKVATIVRAKAGKHYVQLKNIFHDHTARL
jgi:hypothetical protein